MYRLATIPPAVYPRHLYHRRGRGGGTRCGGRGGTLAAEQPEGPACSGQQHSGAHHRSARTQQLLTAITSTTLRSLLPFHLRPCSTPLLL
ncbi:hypothetical protein HF086_018420 [Spodoptera exigua]|uniref:Uncharacterized protein n=1 Tax=Spodoptera exigua TaxID=7107 RepID=A0A922SLU1_SPOEX|nr:hypothetical protein HF086_018420 [Spodoptera exigua]